MQFNTTFKAVIMMVFAMLATLIQQHGIPATTNDWIIAGISIAGTVIVYLGKNLVMESTSTLGNVSIRDAVSGLIMGIGAALSNWVAMQVANIPVNWDDLKKYVISVVIMYLVSIFARGDQAVSYRKN